MILYSLSCPIRRAESVLGLSVWVLGVGAGTAVEFPDAAVAAGDLNPHFLLLSQLRSVAVADDTRVESKEEEDGVGNKEQDFANTENASATLFNFLVGGQAGVSVGGTVVGVNLGNALFDERVLELLVEESDGESDEVSERGDQLDPEEHGEHSDEFAWSDEGSNQSSDGDERKDGEHDAGDDYVRSQALGKVDTVLVTFSDDCPSETRAKTGSDERPKAEDEDAKANGDTEAEFLGGHFDRDTWVFGVTWCLKKVEK